MTSWKSYVFSDKTKEERQHSPGPSLAPRESPELIALALRPRLAKQLPSLTGIVMTWGFAPNPLVGHPGTFAFCHFLRLPLVITFSLAQRKQAQEDTGRADPVSQSSIPDQELGWGTKRLEFCVPRSHWEYMMIRVLTAVEACYGASHVPGQCPGCHCLSFMKMKSSNDSSGCACLSEQLRAGCGM